MFDARGLFRSNRFLLFLSFSPLLFFRVITDKRLKREFSATNIDRETYSGGKEEGKRKRERESLASGNTARSLVRVAGKTISFQRRRSKGSYVSIANDR